jgi:hypothetical protein
MGQGWRKSSTMTRATNICARRGRCDSGVASLLGSGAGGLQFVRTGSSKKRIVRFCPLVPAYARMGGPPSVWNQRFKPANFIYQRNTKTRPTSGLAVRFGPLWNAWKRFGTLGNAWERLGTLGNAWQTGEGGLRHESPVPYAGFKNEQLKMFKSHSKRGPKGLVGPLLSALPGFWRGKVAGGLQFGRTWLEFGSNCLAFGRFPAGEARIGLAREGRIVTVIQPFMMSHRCRWLFKLGAWSKYTEL